MLQQHNLQISYLIQLSGYPLSICGCNIHPFRKLGKRNLQEGRIKERIIVNTLTLSPERNEEIHIWFHIQT
jgi:hypothetical protein